MGRENSHAIAGEYMYLHVHLTYQMFTGIVDSCTQSIISFWVTSYSKSHVNSYAVGCMCVLGGLILLAAFDFGAEAGCRWVCFYVVLLHKALHPIQGIGYPGMNPFQVLEVSMDTLCPPLAHHPCTDVPSSHPWECAPPRRASWATLLPEETSSGRRP